MDLFEGLDGLGGASKKLSLAEQLEAKKKQQRNAFDGLDILGSSTAKPMQQSQPTSQLSTLSSQPLRAPARNTPVESSSVPAAAPQTASSQSDDADLFGLFTSGPPPPKSTTQPRTQPNPKQKPVPQFGEKPQFFDEPNSEPLFSSDSEPRESKKPKPVPNDASADRKLAQLVDMGFDAGDSQRALNAMNGEVRGAVNWLMAEAQGLPLPNPKPRGFSSMQAPADFSEFQAAASHIGASVYSKASSWLSKGRKELEKAYNQYQGSDNGQPAWMRERAKYGARTAHSEGNGLDGDRFDGGRTSSRTGSSTGSSHSTGSSTRNASPSTFTDGNTAESSAPISTERSRPSRAELFRQKHAALGSTLNTPRTGTPSNGTPSNGTSSNGMPSNSMSTEKAAPAALSEEIDLLNLTSDSSGTSLSSTESDMYSASRELGSTAYRRGNYKEAVEHYTTALQIVSNPTPLRALLLANRSAAYLKAGNLRGAFDDTSAGIALLPQRGQSITVERVSMGDIWAKLVTRNAQSAENMEKFKDALKSYQLLLDNGHASPTILDAKRRCIKALNPESVARAEEAKPAKQANRRGWGSYGAEPTSAAGKEALEKVKRNHTAQQIEERERDKLRNQVAQRVDAWKNGNETNLRTLLATLQNVLWQGCEWKPVSSGDLVMPKKVRVVYRKAVARTHPDKVPSTASVEVKMIAQNVFMSIQHAWESFRVENNM